MTRHAPLLEATRERLGSAPRSIPSKTLNSLEFSRPNWIWGDPLWPSVNRIEQTLTEGWITWGMVIVANEILWSPGHQSAPVALVHGLDPSRDPPLLRLEEAARRVRSLRDTVPENYPYPELVRMIQDDRNRAFKVPLPPSLSVGMTLGYSTLLVVPAFLPGRHLASRFLPIVVHPDQDLLAVLPQIFWGEDLKAAWLEWDAG